MLSNKMIRDLHEIIEGLKALFQFAKERTPTAEDRVAETLFTRSPMSREYINTTKIKTQQKRENNEQTKFIRKTNSGNFCNYINIRN